MVSYTGHDTYTTHPMPRAMPGPLTPRHKCTVYGHDDTPLQISLSLSLSVCLSVCLSQQHISILSIFYLSGAPSVTHGLKNRHVRSFARLAPPCMADGDAACDSSLVTKAVCSNLDWHDRWNLLAIGGLNVAHCAWWCSLLPEHLLSALFCADVGYICGDLAWIALVPGCVPPGARPTLLLHHVLTCCCAPVAMGRPVLMAHLLRAWIVELHSWNHIAARQLVRTPRLRKVLQARPCVCTPCHLCPLVATRR